MDANLFALHICPNNRLLETNLTHERLKPLTINAYMDVLKLPQYTFRHIKLTSILTQDVFTKTLRITPRLVSFKRLDT